MRLGVAVSESVVSAVAERRGRVVWAAETPYTDADDLARALGVLAAERPRGVRAAAVALGEGVARVKTVAGLPPLKRHDLANHVRLNSRRYFLQNGVALVTDAMPSRGGDGPEGAALLAGALVPVVEAVVAGLDAAGLRCRLLAPAELLGTMPDGPVEPGADWTPGLQAALRAARARGAELSLLPDAARARDAGEQRASLRRWGAAAFLSLALAVTSWFAGRERAIHSAEHELTRLKPSLESALSARRDLDATDEALSVIGSLDAGVPHRGRFLADLTRALPDSAFLVNVRLDPDGTGSLSGYAPRAAAIAARLERDGLVHGAVFEGPVTREVVAGRELERFALRFRVAAPGAR